MYELCQRPFGLRTGRVLGSMAVRSRHAIHESERDPVHRRVNRLAAWLVWVAGPDSPGRRGRRRGQP
jgi:hypothetical protein